MVIDGSIPEYPVVALAFSTSIMLVAGPYMQVGITAGRERLVSRHPFPGHDEDVAVRHGLDVVMLHHLVVGVVEPPEHVPVPVELFDPSPGALTRVEWPGLLEVTRAQEVAVREEVLAQAGRRGRVPAVDQLAVVVDEQSFVQFER